MRGFIVEADNWTENGPKITEAQKLETIRANIDRRGPLILEHKFYRAARGPAYFLFHEYAEFIEYLNAKPKVGDKLKVWMLCDVCRDDNVLAVGKYPDDKGRVPEKGAY
jgi:hypothetical protein